MESQTISEDVAVTSSKKGNSLVIILVVVLAIVSLALGVITYLYLTKTQGSSTNTTSQTSETEDTDNSEVEAETKKTYRLCDDANKCYLSFEHSSNWDVLSGPEQPKGAPAYSYDAYLVDNGVTKYDATEGVHFLIRAMVDKVNIKAFTTGAKKTGDKIAGFDVYKNNLTDSTPEEDLGHFDIYYIQPKDDFLVLIYNVGLSYGNADMKEVLDSIKLLESF